MVRLGKTDRAQALGHTTFHISASAKVLGFASTIAYLDGPSACIMSNRSIKSPQKK